MSAAVVLTWTAAEWRAGPRTERYQILKEVGSNFVLIGTLNLEYSFIMEILGPELTWTDTDVIAGQTYRYKVLAVTSNGRSLRSNIVSAVAYEPPEPEEIPPVLSGIATLGYFGPTAELEWTEAQWIPSPAVNGYIIRRAEGAGEFATLTTVSAATFAYDDETIVPGTTYRYEVVATSATDMAMTSNEISLLYTEISVSSHDLTAMSSGGQASCSVSFNRGGGLQLGVNGDFSGAVSIDGVPGVDEMTLDLTDQWVPVAQRPPGLDAHEIRLTVNSGDAPNGGADVGVWNPLGGDPGGSDAIFAITHFNGDGAFAGSWEIEIRDAATLVVLSSATITVSGSA